MSYPEYVKVNNELYKIDTDFKVALECDKIYRSGVREEEKVLAIIYLLFGDKGLEDSNNYAGLIEKALKYLLCCKEPNEDNTEPDMDFEQDKSFIKASFYTDYGIADIYNTNMHWWEFCDLMNGLKEDCVLNRIRYIRRYDISDINDKKILKEWEKQKQSVALKKKEPKMTKEQEESMENFLRQINYKGKGG